MFKIFVCKYGHLPKFCSDIAVPYTVEPLYSGHYWGLDIAGSIIR